MPIGYYWSSSSDVTLRRKAGMVGTHKILFQLTCLNDQKGQFILKLQELGSFSKDLKSANKYCLKNQEKVNLLPMYYFE